MRFLSIVFFIATLQLTAHAHVVDKTGTYSSKETNEGIEYKKIYLEDAKTSAAGEQVALAHLDTIPLNKIIRTRTCHHMECLRLRTHFSFAVNSSAAVFDRALLIAKSSFTSEDYGNMAGQTYYMTNTYTDLIEDHLDGKIENSEFIRRVKALLSANVINPYLIWGTSYTGRSSLLSELIQHDYSPDMIFQIFSGFKWDLNQDVNLNIINYYNLYNTQRYTLYGNLAAYKYLSVDFLRVLKSNGLIDWGHIVEGEIMCCVKYPAPNRFINLSASDLFVLVLSDKLKKGAIDESQVTTLYLYLLKDEGVKSAEVLRFKSFLGFSSNYYPKWLTDLIE